MFCVNCGKQLPDNALFCNKCGHRVITAPKSEIPAAPEKKQPAEQQANGGSSAHSGSAKANIGITSVSSHHSTEQRLHTAPHHELTDRERTERAKRRVAARKKKQRRKRIITAAICVLLATLIIVGSWFAFFKDKPENAEPSELDLNSDKLTSDESSIPGMYDSSYVVTSGSEDDFYYDVLSDNRIRITHYTGNASQLTIPSEIADLPVTEIGENAFASCSSLNSVSIPNSVTYIGTEAFFECDALSSITIPNSVSFIDRYALGGTSWLNNQTDEFVIVGDGVLLAYNGNNTHVEVPQDVKMISSAFDSSDFITSISIPDTVSRIGSSAFRNCTSLSSITIPNSVTYIGDYAFYGCESLSSITIPDSVSFIGWHAFWGTSWLSNQTDEFVFVGDGVLLAYNGNDNQVTIPHGIKMISNAFDICYFIERINVPDSVTYIGNYAFYRCDSLSSITIPDSVTHIGDRAFFGCKSLSSITIPDSVAYISENAFEDANPQFQVQENSYAHHWAKNNNLSHSTFNQFYEVEPVAAEETYEYSESSANDFLYSVLPDNTVCITDYLGSESDLIIPEKLDNKAVSEIGKRAFEECGFLETVYIPSGVKYIRENAFYLCYSMKNIQLPEGLFEIEGFVFEDCTSLTSINIPASVTGLGEYAFVNCSALENITLPNAIKTIPDSLFQNCSSLESIVIPNNVTEIGSWAFGDCNALASINIPDSVTKIDSAAFIYCDSLTAIELPDSVTEIYEDAFGVEPNFLLRVPENSYAHKWVQQNAEEYSIDYTVY